MIKSIKIYDLIGFKICWVTCAFCTQWDQPYLGSLITLIFILLHLFIVQFNSRDIQIIFIASILGFIIDTLFFQFNLIQYQGGILANFQVAPLWIISMWAGFAITLLYTLDHIKNKYFTSSLLGIIGGPLSYSAGVEIGSITINYSFSYFLLAICWGVVVPLLFYIINLISSDA